MNAIISLALSTFKENISKNLFSIVLFFLIFLLGAASFAQGAKDSFAQYKIFIDSSYSLIVFFNLIVCFASTYPLYESDLSSNRLHVLLSSYISRTQWVVGKYLGGVFSSISLHIAFCGLVSVFSYFIFAQHPSWLLLGYFVGLLEVLILVGIILTISIVFTRFTGVMIFVLTYILGHFTYYIYYYSMSSEKGSNILENLYLLLPNFEYFGIKNHLISSNPIPGEYWVYLSAFTFFWVCVSLLTADLIFERKEL